MKHTFKSSLIAIAALAIAVMPLHAAEKPGKPAAAAKPKAGVAPAQSNRSLPFNGKLAAKTDSTITVGTRTFAVTADTKITKDGKSATMADGVVGEVVAGSYQEQDGKLVLRSVRFGPKPEPAATEPKPKKE